MTRLLRVAAVAAFLTALPFRVGQGAVAPLAPTGFSVTHQLTLPASPVAVFDAFTGDIRDWWDHSIAEHPKALYIEPKAGGGFYEVFDDSGNGALHATVITAWRGRLLRFEGPLGLTGRAIVMVHTLEFTAQGSDSTLLTLTVNAAGQIEPEIPDIVDRVWHHFLIERFKPYVESGDYRKKVPSAQ